MRKKYSILSALSRKYSHSGDNGGEDPPVPIPNTEVKLARARSTWVLTLGDTVVAGFQKNKRYQKVTLIFCWLPREGEARRFVEIYFRKKYLPFKAGRRARIFRNSAVHCFAERDEFAHSQGASGDRGGCFSLQPPRREVARFQKIDSPFFTGCLFFCYSSLTSVVSRGSLICAKAIQAAIAIKISGSGAAPPRLRIIDKVLSNCGIPVAEWGILSKKRRILPATRLFAAKTPF